MKLKTLLKLDSESFSKLSTGDKMQIVRYMETIANKRIGELKKAGLDYVSPALHLYGGKARKTPMPKTPKNVRKSRELNLVLRLTDSFSRVKNFLSMKTSKTSAVYSYINKARKDFKSDSILKNASKGQQKKFWDAYHRLQDMKPSAFQKGQAGYLKHRQELFEIMTYNTRGGLRFRNIDDAVNDMEKLLDAQYKREMARKAKKAKSTEPEIKYESLNIWESLKEN